MESTPTKEDSQLALAPSLIFKEFFLLGLMGFGGVLPFVRKSLVEKNKWLSNTDFLEVLAIGQTLPGANVVNVSVMLGWRFAGWRGAMAGFVGLLGAPLILLLLLVAFYEHFSQIALMQKIVTGMSISAAALVASTAIKLSFSLSRYIGTMTIALLSFIVIGLLHYSLFIILPILIPLALVYQWWLQIHNQKKNLL